MAHLLDNAARHQCGLCDDRLLRHLRQGQLYWYCPTCRQDTPFRRPIASNTVTSVAPDLKLTDLKPASSKRGSHTVKTELSV
ncbi:MAG: hypothetical protein AAFP20_18370 [Cyanobacteria bacterium J06614_10]